MNEGTKTLSFICGAALAVGIAFIARPLPPTGDAGSPAGKMLNPVEDPLSAAQMKIVEYVEDTAALREFEVARVNGEWVIPSQQNYPADAVEQMADAATSIMNRKILGVATTNAGDHDQYGVIEPKLDLSAGVRGVGMRVTMHDAKNDKLFDLIIGKPVKGQEGQRYVREVGKDPVYVVELDPSHLSTDFGDWIEKDLLKLNPSDVTGLTLKDYSVEPRVGLDGRAQYVIDPRGEIDLACDPEAAEDAWSVEGIKEFNPKTQKYEAVETPADKPLDEEKLAALKTALDDLKIVDVERKPTGLSADLKAEASFADDVEALQSLALRGFYPQAVSSSQVEIFSSEGEVNCRMKDGVVYVLRFGRITLGDQGKEKGEDGEVEDKGTGINRYLFVSARFDAGAVEKPELKELPPAGEEGEKEKMKIGQPPEPKTESADDAEAKRKEIEEENRRKTEAYEEKLKAGRERVKELNSRFGDWYYVISDEVYKKIHLGRDDIFKKAETPAGKGAGLDALDALQQQGLGLPGLGQ
jgi:hypothetical protein